MEVEIEYKGKIEKVKLKRLSWGQNNDCIRKATSMVKGQSQLDQVTMHELRLLASIEEAPFQKNVEELRELDFKVGDKLFNEMQKLNSLSEDDKKNLDTPSSVKNSQATE